MFRDLPLYPKQLSRVVLVAATISLVALGTPCLATAQASTARPTAGATPSSAVQAITAGSPKVEYNPTAYAAATKSTSWVQTPDGLAYKTCVHTLPTGAHMEGATIVLASGVRSAPAACPYPRLVDSPGKVHGPSAGSSGGSLPETQDGWFQASWWDADQPLRGITSDYTVPSAPSANGAIDFFFSSLEDADGSDILQPVLGYGTNGKAPGSGYYWYIQSWYLWGVNNFAIGNIVRVNIGDTIAASVMGNDCDTDGTHCYFTVTAKDLQTGMAATLPVTSDQYFHSAQGGVFESHYSPHCTYLPSNGNVDFTNIKVFGNSGAQVTPSWVGKDFDQECSMVLDYSNTETYIHWTP